MMPEYDTTSVLGDRTCTMYPRAHVCILYDQLNRPVEVKLKPIEWKLLEVLLRNSNRLLTYQTISKKVWGEEQRPSRAALTQWHMANLRQTLQAASGRQSTPIKTVYGFGYKWVTS
jgi:DNA-binding response OmpR family regulator